TPFLALFSRSEQTYFSQFNTLSLILHIIALAKALRSKIHRLTVGTDRGRSIMVWRIDLRNFLYLRQRILYRFIARTVQIQIRLVVPTVRLALTGTSRGKIQGVFTSQKSTKIRPFQIIDSRVLKSEQLLLCTKLRNVIRIAHKGN